MPSVSTLFGLLMKQEAEGEYRYLPRSEIMVRAGPVELAVTAAGERMVLVPLEPGAQVEPDRRSAGVHIEKLTLLRPDGSREFLAVRCMKPHLNAVFELVAEDLLRAFTQAPEDPAGAARKVLGQWRELLARDPSRHPSPETIRGAWGELWHLRELVERGVPDAVLLWTGPSGQQNVHDFLGADTAIEVKTITQRTELVVKISSLEQLEAPPKCRLALSCLVVEELFGEGERVRDLVDALRLAGIPAVELAKRLSARGIDAVWLKENDVPGYRVLEHHAWLVEGGFPRLTPSLLGDLLPAEVTSTQYRLDLTARRPESLDAAGWSALMERMVP